MLRRVAVVIPALNEERSIAAAIDSARRAGVSEIVVADGGSSDRTVAIATESGAQVLRIDGVRGKRLNAGAEGTSSEILLFLHADTILPGDAVKRVSAAVDDGAIFGGFRIRFAEPHLRLRVAAAMINLRCLWSRCPWGDQGQWVVRDPFVETGCFGEDPIMEDYEMAIRMKRHGTTRILASAVTTSGRRFLQKGLFRTALINWRIIVLWRLGASTDRLARIYRSD